MAKAPRVGAVKTRLVPPLNTEQAAALNRCFVQDITRSISAICAESAVHGFVAYTPVGEESAFDDLLPPEFRLIAQRGADLTERLIYVADDLFAAGYSEVCLMNSDTPTLPLSVLNETVAVISSPGDRAVLGPAEDGGYYLIGLKRSNRRLFENIPWSSGVVLAKTLERAAESGLKVELLPVWYDVDDQPSLLRLFRELIIGEVSARETAPHTYRYLRELMLNLEGFRIAPNL
jgi:rSAM/selenodomain-associated transferase 1